MPRVFENTWHDISKCRAVLNRTVRLSESYGQKNPGPGLYVALAGRDVDQSGLIWMLVAVIFDFLPYGKIPSCGATRIEAGQMSSVLSFSHWVK